MSLLKLGFVKISEQNSSYKPFLAGAFSGLASTFATHPIEDALYGRKKFLKLPGLKPINLEKIRANSWKHLLWRTPKAMIAMGTGYGVYEGLKHTNYFKNLGE